MDDIETLQRDALRALGDVLRDPATRAADRLRAAEAILRAEGAGHGAQGQELAALSDEALLLIAKGGTPPNEGPVVPAASAVPSGAVEVPSAGPATGGAPGVTSLEQTAEGDSPHPFLIKRGGPKEDPKWTAHADPAWTRGVPPIGGPKEDPPKKKGRGRPKKDRSISGQLPPAPQIGQTAEPDPWD